MAPHLAGLVERRSRRCPLPSRRRHARTAAAAAAAASGARHKRQTHPVRVVPRNDADHHARLPRTRGGNDSGPQGRNLIPRSPIVDSQGRELTTQAKRVSARGNKMRTWARRRPFWVETDSSSSQEPAHNATTTAISTSTPVKRPIAL